jgi:hypothetical protein
MARLGRASRAVSDDLAGNAGGIDNQRNTDTALSQLRPTPISSDEQGVGKSPGFQWPVRDVLQMLVPKGLKQGAVGATAAGRSTPSRPEKRAWAAAYLAYYEQENRHQWPGTPGQIHEHPQSVPLTRLVQELTATEELEGIGG